MCHRARDTRGRTFCGPRPWDRLSAGATIPARASPLETTTTDPDLTGSTVSHYEVLERIGTGGMGVVYKARDTALNRLVALKFLPSRLTGDEEATRRFVEEARTASALDHAHICTVHEISQTTDGLLFMVMSYVPGETLKERIARETLPVEDALDIAIQVTEGLMEAHEHGIAHRDVKPGNVLITPEDRVKIVDFGLASLVGLPPENKPGLFMGTLLYMSPEQLRNEPVDHRSDIWSLGVTMYEMLAGRPPFGTSDDQPVVHAILYEAPRPLAELRPDVPAELASIIDRCLRKDRAERHRLAVDLYRDLVRCRRNLVRASTAALHQASSTSHAPVPAPRRGLAALARRLFSRR